MKDKILNLIEEKKYKELQSELSQLHVPDIADLFEEIDSSVELMKIFKLLPKDIEAEVFSYLDIDCQQKLLDALSAEDMAYIIKEMSLDDAVDFVEELPANVVEKALRGSNQETRQLINDFLGYTENTAGSIMTPEFIDLKEDMTVEYSLKRIKKLGEYVETINILYITDSARIIKGVLSIKELLLADNDKKVGEIMNTNVIFAETSTDQEEIANLFKQYEFLALPIVDKERRLVGIVTVDDIMDVIEEETTEDISKMNAVTPNQKSYLKTSPFRLWWNRFPWLMLLMVSATFTGLIISKNETLLSQGFFGILLTSCLPMMMDTGGNAGGQASATIIRGIALNEIDFKDLFKVMLKEFVVGCILGMSLSVVCFGKIMLVDGLIFQTKGVEVISAAVISLCMMITIIIAKLVGCSLPLIAKKCKLDPAVMASPFITTIVDALSLLVYCNLAIALLM